MKRFASFCIAIVMILLMAGCQPGDTVPEGSIRRYLITEACRYYADGEAYMKESYTYDGKGRMTGYVLEEYGDLETYRSYANYQYDEHGNLVYIDSFFFNRRIESKYEYTYNPDGTVASYICNNTKYKQASDEIDYHYVSEICDYTYDSAGRLTNYVQKNAESRVIEEYVFSYDEQGRLVEQIYTHEYGTETTIFAYNENGDVIRIEGPYLNVEYTYDVDGKLTAKVLKSSSYRDCKWDFTYTEGKRTQIDYLENLNNTGPKIQSYSVNADGMIEKLIYQGPGAYNTYQYTSVVLTQEEALDVPAYWDVANEVIIAEEFYQKIVTAYLPKGN